MARKIDTECHLKAYSVYEKSTGRQIDVVFFDGCDDNYVEKVIECDYSVPVTIYKPKQKGGANGR